MRVAVVAHALDQPTRGNHTTVHRWREYVTEVDLLLVPPDAEREIDPVPDLFHGYHALHGGIAARALAHRYKRPFVISLGGTDLACIVEKGEGCPEVLDVLREAQLVTGAFQEFRALLPATIAYRTVPRGVPLHGTPRPRTPDGTLRVLLPAGLREVKDPLRAVEMAKMLHARGLPIALRIVGPVMSDSYAARVHGRTAALDYVSVGEVERAHMTRLYRACDVVWNTSRSEGGSNSLLEALAEGRAVFARDVLGNREMLPPEWRFDPADEDRIEAFHRALLVDTSHAHIEQGLALLRAHHDPHEEAAALKRVWAEACGARSGAPYAPK